MLELKRLLEISGNCIDEKRDAILRQVNNDDEEINIDFEKRQIIWQLAQSKLIKDLIDKGYEYISNEYWTIELKKLDKLDFYLRHEKFGG
jgi:hypothetical protein